MKATNQTVVAEAERLGATVIVERFQFDAYCAYWVAVSTAGVTVLYEHYNPRANTDCSSIEQFESFQVAANAIWKDGKGTIRFDRIAAAILRKFGVDVTIDAQNSGSRSLFGEAG